MNPQIIEPSDCRPTMVVVWIIGRQSEGSIIWGFCNPWV